ncbi:UNVERIFIED_CONTAM: hypothetical protein K2H54_021463, partial [Gekko kuhli]
MPGKHPSLRGQQQRHGATRVAEEKQNPPKVMSFSSSVVGARKGRKQAAVTPPLGQQGSEKKPYEASDGEGAGEMGFQTGSCPLGLGSAIPIGPSPRIE